MKKYILFFGFTIIFHIHPCLKFNWNQLIIYPLVLLIIEKWSPFFTLLLWWCIYSKLIVQFQFFFFNLCRSLILLLVFFLGVACMDSWDNRLSSEFGSVSTEIGFSGGGSAACPENTKKRYFVYIWSYGISESEDGTWKNGWNFDFD